VVVLRLLSESHMPWSIGALQMECQGIQSRRKPLPAVKPFKSKIVLKPPAGALYALGLKTGALRDPERVALAR
jgi:hypothetical protein